MRRRLKAGTAALVAGTALASGMVATPGAHAAPPAATAPASVDWCLSASVREGGWTDTLTISNSCGYSVRAKVVLDFAFDSCVTVPAAGARYLMHYPARFNRLEECG
ncbi:MAG: hypothetical protein ACRD2C_20060 [Acidimicrobiales bacterium]